MLDNITDKQLNCAKTAYQQYCNATGYKDTAGRSIPDWNATPDQTKLVWVSVVGAVADDIKAAAGDTLSNLDEIIQSPTVIRITI